MDLRPAAVIERFRGKALRYVSVSVFGTVLTQAQLVTYVKVLDWNPAVANVVAVTVACIPGYFLTKEWVWRHRDRTAMRREALAFWLANLAGLLLSTLFVVIADQFSDATWVVSLANLAGFGVLWVAKFLVFDEYLFKQHSPLVEI